MTEDNLLEKMKAKYTTANVGKSKPIDKVFDELLARNASMRKGFLYHTYGLKSRLKKIFGDEISNIYNLDGSLKLRLKFFSVQRMLKDLKDRSTHVKYVTDLPDILASFSDKSAEVRVEQDLMHLVENRIEELGVKDNTQEIICLSTSQESVNYTALQQMAYQNFVWSDPSYSRGKPTVLATGVKRACVLWNKVV